MAVRDDCVWAKIESYPNGKYWSPGKAGCSEGKGEKQGFRGYRVRFTVFQKCFHW